MKKILLTLAAVGFASIGAHAQSPEELLMFSRQNFSMSTARSAAMGGAFTSLGADGITMSLNPAGLAMYSSPEISLSPALSITDMRASYGNTRGDKGNYTKPYIGNFSGVFANGNGWAWGLALNRIADFSGRYTATGTYDWQSKAYIYRDQLQGKVTQGSMDKIGQRFNRPPVFWNAIMADQTWLVNPTFDGANNTDYDLDEVLEHTKASNGSVRSDFVASQLDMTTNGAIDEVAFSAAYNWENKIYFGATFGMQSLFYRQSTTYNEFADLNNAGGLDSFQEYNSLALDGFGVNLKVGLTIRPVEWFRVGVAYHSPTWITMREVSYGEMGTWLRPGFATESNRSEFTPDLAQNYDYRTPSRLMAGVSFTIARRVILSADYERAWYNDMKFNTKINADGWRQAIEPNDVSNMPNVASYTDSRGNIDMNSMIRNSYRPTNNFRFGIEAQPANGFFLRAGYAYSDSPYASVGSVYDENVTLNQYGALSQYSGGIGFRRRSFGIDLAYIYSTRTSLPSVFYDYVATSDYWNAKGDVLVVAAGESIISSSNIAKKIENHNVILTFAWRF